MSFISCTFGLCTMNLPAICRRCKRCCSCAIIVAFQGMYGSTRVAFLSCQGLPNSQSGLGHEVRTICIPHAKACSTKLTGMHCWLSVKSISINCNYSRPASEPRLRFSGHYSINATNTGSYKLTMANDSVSFIPFPTRPNRALQSRSVYKH